MCTEYPLCKYAYYEANKDGFMVLKCQKSNKPCAYSRYCSLLLKVIHTSAYNQCALNK